MGNPVHVPKTYNCVSTFVDRHVEEGRDDKVAIYYKDAIYTYGDLYKNVNRVGNFLKELGVERENRIFLLLPDSPELVFSLFGTMKIAAVFISINTRLTPDLYAYMLNDSRAKVLIIHKSLLDKLKPVEKELRFLKHKIVVGGKEEGYLDFYDLLGAASSELSPEETHRNDVAFWLYTSGSTGEPKGVVHLHHDAIQCTDSYAKEVVDISSRDISLSVSKIFHAYGFGNTVCFPFRVGGSTVLLDEIPKPESVLKAIDTYKVTLFYGVSTFYAMCLAIKDIEKKFSLKSLRLCASAGEALPAITYQRWLEKFNVEIIDGIGSTEVLHIYVSNRPKRVKPGSLGFPVPGYEIKIVDPEGAPVKDGEVGTLWVKGESTTPYFWNKHKKTKIQCKGEWFNTEDLFYKDEDGYYWYYGRSDDAFKYRGEWVVPVEVEGIIIEHPAVLENAVIGLEDEKDGLCKPMAFVVLKSGFNPTKELEDDIKKHVRGKLPGYKVPYWIKFVDDLPKTASGKIQRFKLRLEILPDDKN